MEVGTIALNGQQAFKKWGLLSVQKRIQVLKNFYDLIGDHQSEIIAAEAQDTRKNLREVEGDLDYSLSMLMHAIDLLEDKLQETDGHNSHLIDGVRYSNRSFPFGVVVCVVPWNFPLVVAFERIPFMLAAGNVVVWKSSESTCKSARLLSQLFMEASDIPFVLQACSFGIEDTKLLLKSNIDFISFTGSTRVGYEIMCNNELAAIPKSLELGGKNIAYVDKSADIESSATLLVNSFFRNNGHSCIQPSLAYIDECIYDSFKSAFVNSIERRILFQEMSPSYDHKIYEALVNGFERSMPDKSVRVFNENSFFTPAALILELTEDAVEEHEYFCPIITFVKVKNVVNLFADSKNNSYGLAALLYSQNNEVINSFCAHVSAGRLWINSEQRSIPRLRIGGLRGSGNCWICGEHALEDYVFNKAIVSTQDQK